LRKTCIARRERQKSVIVTKKMGREVGGVRKKERAIRRTRRSTKNIIQWRRQGKKTTNTKYEC
jgi:hypothetical protein